MSTMRVYTREFRESAVGLVLSPCCLSVASWSLDPRSGPGPWHALSTRRTVGSATNCGRGERRLSMRRARNEGSPSAGEPWCGSMQSRVKSTAHRRSRASFRNLVSPLIATRSRESCRSEEYVRNMYESTVQRLRGVRTRIRRRQIFWRKLCLSPIARQSCSTQMTQTHFLGAKHSIKRSSVAFR